MITDDAGKSGRGLSATEVRKFYNSLGRKQDIQFYENRALDALIRFSGFASAGSVFEFGCGTGRLAAELLERYLKPECTYRGVDISETMVDLSRRRLAVWSDRASVILAGGRIAFDSPADTFDRFVSTYVLDLLNDDDTRLLLNEAHRLLVPGGLLCIVSLTRGETPLCRLVSSAWTKLFVFKPYWVGGCRPIDAGRSLDRYLWNPVHDEVISAFGVSSEVVVAAALKKGIIAGKPE